MDISHRIYFVSACIKFDYLSKRERDDVSHANPTILALGKHTGWPRWRIEAMRVANLIVASHAWENG